MNRKPEEFLYDGKIIVVAIYRVGYVVQFLDVNEWGEVFVFD